MYIRTARLKDVKCFDEVELRFQSAAETGDRQSNWNVILGKNGEGKTTVIQGIATCLMDATTADRMLRPAGWVRGRARSATLSATIIPEEADFWGDVSQGPESPPREIQYAILAPGKKPGKSANVVPTETLVGPSYEYEALFGEQFGTLSADFGFLMEGPFLVRPGRGWFSAAYGPLRRPSSAKSGEFTPSDNPLERRFSTMFQERAALFDVDGWLKEQDWLARRAERDSPLIAHLPRAIAALKSLLPGLDEIQFVGKDVVFFRHGIRTTLEQLSHGYRTMFGLTIDILRGMADAWVSGSLTEGRGVVLIDEIDAHLHPEWQRQVGFDLCKTFPNLQFIVTTHSPFVAMAAGKGGLTLLQRDDECVHARQDLPYVRGWAVDEVLEQLFGLDSLRDPETAKKLDSYERLRTLERTAKLGPQQAKTLAKLRAYLDERLSGEPASPKNQRIDEDMKLMSEALKERRKKHA